VTEHFLDVYEWSGGKGSVTEDTGVDHTMGIGLSTNACASMTASGTSTVSLSSSASQGGIVDSTVWNRVNYRDHISNCGPDERRPVDYYDMLSNDWSFAPHNNFTASCVTKLAGSTFTTSTAKNSTYTTGVDIGSISVSAQSGYTAGMHLLFSFTSRSNSASGPAQSSQVDSRAGEAWPPEGARMGCDDRLSNNCSRGDEPIPHGVHGWQRGARSVARVAARHAPRRDRTADHRAKCPTLPRVDHRMSGPTRQRHG
jgi:hypothetical protein